MFQYWRVCVCVSWQMLDVPTVLNLLRHQRMMMVQTLSQYTFIYKVLIQFLRNSRLIWDQRWHRGPTSLSQPLSPRRSFLTVLVTGRDTSRGQYEGRCATLCFTSIIHRFHCGLIHRCQSQHFYSAVHNANDAALLFNAIRWTVVVLLYRVGFNLFTHEGLASQNEKADTVFKRLVTRWTSIDGRISRKAQIWCENVLTVMLKCIKGLLFCILNV